MAEPRLCSIQSCGKTARKRGWCTGHYQRWWSYGDPLAGNTSRGELLQYLRKVVLTYEGEDCLIWPYSNNAGYGLIRLDRKMVRVNRLVCEAEHGPPPTPYHQAAHDCGKGHLGCCSRKHLRWATQSENEADKIIHGTTARATGTTLTVDDVHRIRSLRGVMTQKEIGALFGIEQCTVSRIQSREKWGWLD